MSEEKKGIYVNQFEFVMDSKGRANMPMQWRREFFETQLYAFPMAEALRVYPISAVIRIQESARNMPLSSAQRIKLETLASEGQEIRWDKDRQFRFTIEDRLRSYAGLEKKITLVGRFDSFEIWSPERLKKRAVKEIHFEEAIGDLRF